MTAAEVAKLKNLEDVVKSEEERERKKEELAEEILKDKELLEWSRSDSPVRMYLREMGHIPLLDKDEEIEIFRRIQLGEEIILDAICSIPFLIDLVLKYKEPLLNRERRVKELFKSFVDEEEVEDEDSKEGKRKKKISIREKRINELRDELLHLQKEMFAIEGEWSALRYKSYRIAHDLKSQSVVLIGLVNQNRALRRQLKMEEKYKEIRELAEHYLFMKML